MAKTQASPAGPPDVQQPITTGDAGAPRVRLTIEGGVRGEEYRFHFEAAAGGGLAYGLKSELTGRHIPDAVGRIDPSQFERLLRTAEPGQLQRAQRGRLPPIPPCSLVGRLDIFDGAERAQIVFMADPEQARQAGHRLPPAVRRTVDRIYALAAAEMRLESAADVRPYFVEPKRPRRRR
jgi:hypothetical protein